MPCPDKYGAAHVSASRTNRTPSNGQYQVDHFRSELLLRHLLRYKGRVKRAAGALEPTPDTPKLTVEDLTAEECRAHLEPGGRAQGGVDSSPMAAGPGGRSPAGAMRDQEELQELVQEYVGTYGKRSSHMGRLSPASRPWSGFAGWRGEDIGRRHPNLARSSQVPLDLPLVSPSAVNAISLHVSVPVLDPAEAETFYSVAFGVRTTDRTPTLVTMEIAGQRLTLRKVADDSTSLQRGARDGLRARHFGFGVPTPQEVDMAVDVLVALGAHLVVEPTDRYDGRSAVFCDQSGNQVEVYFEEANHGQAI